MDKFSLNLLKFEDIRTEIVNVLKTNSEFSGQFDFTSSNIGLIVDSMAYVTMLMSYQLTNTTNNLFLDSTDIRKNALSIAKNMGYRPQRAITSRVTGTIEYYDPNNILTGYTITIPANTPFISDTSYTYINYTPIVLVSGTDIHRLTADIILYEGSIKHYSYLGTGSDFQSFIIPSTKIDENHFDLQVRKNNELVGTKWEEVKKSFNLIDKNSYFVEEDIVNECYVKVCFGDNVITNSPSINDIVDIMYLETNDTLANNSKILFPVLNNVTNTFPDSIVYDINNFISVESTLSKSYGGTPIETLDIIKERASKSFATVGRAVTQNDYVSLLKEQPYIINANAIGGDTLYPKDSTKLGNIYLSAIPIIENMNSDFYNSNAIYLDNISESSLLNDLNRYKIIATELIFLKPTYITIDVEPLVEVKHNLSNLELGLIKTNINTALATYAKTLLDFTPIIRESKINGIITEIQGVVSSSFTTKYSFALTRNTLYYPNTTNNMVFLPIVADTIDAFGNITKYTNFVKTNVEQSRLKKIILPNVLDISDRTIYGKIHNINVERYLYNEDTEINMYGEPAICDIKIHGKNNFFSFYRFDTSLENNIISDVKNFTFGTTSTDLSITETVSIDKTLDTYTIKLNDYEIGSVVRTENMNCGFKGLIYKEDQISSTTHGDFYKVISSFQVNGAKYDFTIPLYKDDIIIYDANINKWKKAIMQQDISAVTDNDLYTKLLQYEMFSLIPNISGNFNGQTPTVSDPDKLIFNYNGTTKWSKINDNTLSFDATTQIVQEATPFEIKRITNLDFESTNFDGRLDFTVVDNDLIYYDDIYNTWTQLGNLDYTSDYSVISYISGEVPAIPISTNGGSLDGLGIFNNTAVGSTFLVTGIGDFGTSRDLINWNSETTAYDGDILLYIGNDRWNLFQLSEPDKFNINGKIISALPIKLNFGDKFSINNAGDFIGTADSNTYTINDYIVYTSNNTWTKYILSDIVLDQSSPTLPSEATLGDMHTIIEDGNFNNNSLIYPPNDTFVEGDVLIYNGSYYTKVNEYTFRYNTLNMSELNITAKQYLNYLGFNSVFHYEYDVVTEKYIIYFNDVYHQSTIGTFRYNGATDDTQLDIGKLQFNILNQPYTTRRYNYKDIDTMSNIQDIFDNTINKIYFLPKNKLDNLGNLTTNPETKFDTHYNTFMILNTLPVSTTLD